jgi:hypothetical protein
MVGRPAPRARSTTSTRATGHRDARRVCHDLGKPPTTAVIDGRIRSLGHEEAGVAPRLVAARSLNVNSMDGVDVRGQVLGSSRIT